VASLHYYSEIVHSVEDLYCRFFLRAPNIASIVAMLDCAGNGVQPENVQAPDARGRGIFRYIA
jgi:hypothetical protein